MNLLPGPSELVVPTLDPDPQHDAFAQEFCYLAESERLKPSITKSKAIAWVVQDVRTANGQTNGHEGN